MQPEIRPSQAALIDTALTGIAVMGAFSTGDE